MNFRIAQLFSGLMCFAIAIFLFIQEGRWHVEDDTTFEEFPTPEASDYERLLMPAVPSEEPGPLESAAPSIHQKKYVVQFGDTLYSFFLRHISSVEDVQEIIRLLKKEGFFKTLKAGSTFTITTELKEGKSSFQRLSFFVKRKKIVVEKKTDGKMTVRQLALTQKHKYISGLIQDGLYADAKKQGAPLATTNQFVKLLSHNVDFQRSLHHGDRFEMLIDIFVDEELDKEVHGDIVYAAIHLKDGPQNMYRFRDESGTQYYNGKAQGTVKALLKTPVPGARLSSRYGLRRHPVLGYSKMHKGIDFAAPRGTPILAAGDGVVEKASPYSTFGNYIRIRHNKEFSTAYAHLSRYASGVRAGKKVKQGQIIGYVGCTGRTTGPHLHYEVLKHGRQINPQALTLPSQQKLAGKTFEAFKRQKAQIDQEVKRLSAGRP